MVTTGFSRIHVAKYANAGTTVTYSACRELARGKKMDISVNSTEENKFYANNQVAETEPRMFKDGKVAMTVDGLTAEEEAFILGVSATEKVTVGEKEVEVYHFGDNVKPPYLAVAGVKEEQLNGVPSYKPIIVRKCRFAIPPEAGESRDGDTINWQIQNLEATISRDDTAAHNWKTVPKTSFDTEEEAVAFIRAVLGGVTA